MMSPQYDHQCVSAHVTVKNIVSSGEKKLSFMPTGWICNVKLPKIQKLRYSIVSYFHFLMDGREAQIGVARGGQF